MDGVTETNLVIGEGEIGKALAEILDCQSHDIEPLPEKHYDIIHIAIPFTKQFNKIVKNYQERYTPEFTVIHSTVPVGTSEKLGACHSPVTGVHPHLVESIKTFTKFVGGEGSEEVAKALRRYNIPTKAVSSSRDTEAGKIAGLLIYGINILLEKEIYNHCQANKLNYDVVYTDFIKMYNEGYEIMGMNHIKMYELEHKEGKIGGHCVAQNGPMLGGVFGKLLKRYGKRN